jgi:hypothetical protein
VTHKKVILSTPCRAALLIVLVLAIMPEPAPAAAPATVCVDAQALQAIRQLTDGPVIDAVRTAPNADGALIEDYGDGIGVDGGPLAPCGAFFPGGPPPPGTWAIRGE